MAREPSYPNDAPVGSAAASPTGEASDGQTQAATPAGGEGSGDARRRKQLMTGAAIGIGSAALVAALLYANRGRKGDRT